MFKSDSAIKAFYNPPFCSDIYMVDAFLKALKLSAMMTCKKSKVTATESVHKEIDRTIFNINLV